MKKKNIFVIILIVFLLGFLGYFSKGAYDYRDWLKTKQAIADGGFTNLYAGTFGEVTSGCTYSTSGCSCSYCSTCCNTYDQAIISIGQTVNKGAQYLCVANSLQVKGTPLASSKGKQFMAGSLSGQCLTANAVLATPSMAANNFEKLISFIPDFIIAGFTR